MTDDILYEISTIMDRAEARYGRIASTHEALGVALEEWDELRQAVRDNDLRQIERECIDLAAVLVRLARACRIAEDGFVMRSVK